MPQVNVMMPTNLFLIFQLLVRRLEPCASGVPYLQQLLRFLIAILDELG